MTVVLAIDAGGSHTRAACIDATGRVLGWGTASGGNVTSLGDEGLRAVEAAARAAIVDADADPTELNVVLCAAGEAPIERLAQVAGALGMPGATSWHVVGDALGAYFSGSASSDGIVLIAGTGVVAAHVEQGNIARVVDGLGWLVGDAGGGFWIGREVVSAVAAALDGRGPSTSLTSRLLTRISSEGKPWSGVRTPEVARLLREVYAHPPASLARFAPLAFEAAEEEDAVAGAIISQAERHLVSTLSAARRGHEDLPVVVAGSVLTQGILSARWQAGTLREALRDAEVRRATDGIVGAATLALRRRGVDVSDSLRRVMAEQVELRRA